MSVCVLVCVCVSVFLSVCYYCFISDCRIYLFSSLAARVFNKLTRYAEKAQQRYVSSYNLSAREKSFSIGQKVLILMPDSTSSKLFSRWVGPGVIKEKQSAHTYLVDINGSLKHIHADKLRVYHIAVDEIVCDTVVAGHAQTKINHCAVIYDKDHDFGEIDVIDANHKVNTVAVMEIQPSHCRAKKMT